MPVAILTAEEMKSVENWTRANLGISESEMISMAGKKVYEFCRVFFDQLNTSKDKNWLFLCGKGHNGADGIRAAISASEDGYRVKVFQIFSPKGYSEETGMLQKMYSKLGTIDYIQTADDLKISDNTGLIVDGLLGAGITRQADGLISECIDKVNASHVPVVAIDIPSGLFTDSSENVIHLHADATVMLGSPKLSSFFHPTRRKFGQTEFYPLCFPSGQLNTQASDMVLFSEKDAVSALPSRNYDSHKYSTGKVLIIAGSEGMHGAAVLSARSCARAGAGMVKLAVPAGIHPEICRHTIETISIPAGRERLEKDSGAGWFEPEDAETLLPLANWADAVLVGPGLGKHPQTISFLNELIPRISAPLILDGDGLQFFNTNSGNSKKSGKYINITCTPHGGEYKKMGGCYCYERPLDHVYGLRELSGKLGVSILLKGPTSLFCGRGKKCVVLPAGNPGLATAGTGDVLAGIITAFNCLLDQAAAASLGTYIHGCAADKAAETTGILSMTALDVINSIPAVIKHLETKKAGHNPVKDIF